MELHRNTKFVRVKKHKKKLSTSISKRLIYIRDNCTEFRHWDIDAVICEKTKNDNVILNIVECKTIYAIVLKAIAKNALVVMDVLNKVRDLFGEQFSQVFKSLTSNNGSEFADLFTIESETNIPIYFNQPYSFFEKYTNECEMVLYEVLSQMENVYMTIYYYYYYYYYYTAFIEDWMNTFPRRVLRYRTPEELFQ